MVGGEHDHRFVVEISFPEDFDQSGTPWSIEAPDSSERVPRGFQGYPEGRKESVLFSDRRTLLRPSWDLRLGLVAEKIGLRSRGSLVLPPPRAEDAKYKKKGFSLSSVMNSRDCSAIWTAREFPRRKSRSGRLGARGYFPMCPSVTGFDMAREGQSDGGVITRELVKGVWCPYWPLADKPLITTDRLAEQLAVVKALRKSVPSAPGHRWPGPGSFVL